jgi:hypothetical protein
MNTSQNQDSVDIEMPASLEKLHDFFKIFVEVWVTVERSGKPAALLV